MRTDTFAGEQELLGIAAMHDLQAHHRDDRRSDADPDLTEGEARILRCNGEIARRHEAVAAACDVALHATDDRLGVIEHRHEHIDEPARASRCEAAAGRRDRSGQVSPGAEGCAATRQDDDTHSRVTRGRAQMLEQQRYRLGVEPVLGVRTIQGDRRYSCLDDARDGSTHFLPMPSSIEMTRSMTSSAPPPIETSRASRK